MAKLEMTEATLSAENRVVIPREVRAALGVRAGDRIVFHVDADGLVRLLTSRLMAASLWAKNHGGDAGDSAEDVRQERNKDQSAAEAKYVRIAVAREADNRTEDEVAADLMSALGLD